MHTEMRRAHAIAMFTSGLVFVLAIVTMAFLPVPYVVQAPGPTINTLGEYRDIKLISIEGTDVYPDSKSELRLTTVVAAGGPGYPVNLSQAIEGWASSTATVMPVEYLYPPTVSREDLDASAEEQMARSQHDATVMALAELGIEVPVKLEIVGTDQQANSHGKVSAGDILIGLSTQEISYTPIKVYADLATALAATPPGTVVTLRIERDGVEQDVSFASGDDGYGGSLLGIYLNPEFDMPFDVKIEVDRVGGPSAGTMFALGIIDLLTPDSLVGDHIVAGTGTIGLNGRVGEIGGIPQKMQGAVRDGAEYFLAPGENCPQVQGNIPDGLTVFRVDTFTDLINAADAIRTGDTADLPTCDAA